MGKQDMYDNICKKCYVKKHHPSNKEISKIVFTEYKEQCSCCGRKDFLVDYVEDYYE